MIWQHWTAVVVYILAGILYFNALCIMSGVGMRPREYRWAACRAIAWPIDVFRVLLRNWRGR